MIIFRKERLEAELAALRDEWRRQMERSLKTVAEETLARLTEDSQAMEKEVAARVAGMGEAFAEATSQTESKLSALREALNQQEERSHQAILQLEASGERINDEALKLAQVTGEMDLKLSELRRYLNGQDERLYESLRQLQAAEERLDAQISRLDLLAQTAEQRLESRAATLLEASSQEMTRRAQASEQVLEEATRRMQNFMQDLLSKSESQMEESGRAAAAKWIAVLEEKATDATYTAFGSLFKVSEWCEKKAQMHMQTALEKGLDAASDNVREKAEAALQEFSAKAEAASGRIAALVEEERAQIRGAWETEGEQLTSRLRTAFTQEAEATLRKAGQDVLDQVNSALETIRVETRAQENGLKDVIAQLSDQAIQAHETRLNQASRSSLQEMISRFSQEASALLETLVGAAEQRLRHTCNDVFAEAGEALRQRLLELTFPRSSAKAAGDSP